MMSEYTSRVIELRQRYNNTEKLRKQIEELVQKSARLNEEYVTMLEAQQLLAAISEENTNSILDYIVGVINKALAEIFPYDERRVYLEKKLHNGQHAHINVKLTGSNGVVRDLNLQTGTGLRQIISFLFLVSLIEIRGGRKVLLMDELFSGLHKEAKRIIMDIIQIFAEEGFQFIFVEYGVNDMGKKYIVEKMGETAKVYPLDSEYNDSDVFVFNRPVEEVDKSVVVDEGVE